MKDKKLKNTNKNENEIGKETEKEEKDIKNGNENEKNSGNDVENEKTEIKNDACEKDKEIADLKDRLLRQAAEFDNYRKRTARERMEFEAEITARVVTGFLPSVDNLERALAAECTDENYKKGVEMIYGGFVEALNKLGVEEIKTDGEIFNPACHQAVQQIESDDTESGMITAAFQKGYKIGDKIIRFSMVAVAK